MRESVARCFLDPYLFSEPLITRTAALNTVLILALHHQLDTADEALAAVLGTFMHALSKSLDWTDFVRSLLLYSLSYGKVRVIHWLYGWRVWARARRLSSRLCSESSRPKVRCAHSPRLYWTLKSPVDGLEMLVHTLSESLDWSDFVSSRLLASLKRGRSRL